MDISSNSLFILKDAIHVGLCRRSYIIEWPCYEFRPYMIPLANQRVSWNRTYFPKEFSGVIFTLIWNFIVWGLQFSVIEQAGELPGISQYSTRSGPTESVCWFLDKSILQYIVEGGYLIPSVHMKGVSTTPNMNLIWTTDGTDSHSSLYDSMKDRRTPPNRSIWGTFKNIYDGDIVTTWFFPLRVDGLPLIYLVEDLSWCCKTAI